MVDIEGHRYQDKTGKIIKKNQNTSLIKMRN